MSMTIALTRVKDIGPVAAEALAKHGISSAEALAALSPAQLGKVPGFGPLRSERVIAAAKSLLATAESAGIDVGQKGGPMKPRSSEPVAGQKGKGKGKGSKQKRKVKSGSGAGDAGKQPGKGKGGKNKDKGDKKKPGQKKDAKKRDKKKKGKKKK